MTGVLDILRERDQHLGGPAHRVGDPDNRSAAGPAPATWRMEPTRWVAADAEPEAVAPAEPALPSPVTEPDTSEASSPPEPPRDFATFMQGLFRERGLTRQEFIEKAYGTRRNANGKNTGAQSVWRAMKYNQPPTSGVLELWAATLGVPMERILAFCETLPGFELRVRKATVKHVPMPTPPKPGARPQPRQPLLPQPAPTPAPAKAEATVPPAVPPAAAKQAPEDQLSLSIGRNGLACLRFAADDIPAKRALQIVAALTEAGLLDPAS